jgi:hypothetical protein
MDACIFLKDAENSKNEGLNSEDVWNSKRIDGIMK